MEQDREPENIITTEGKIGYEWLLTKQIERINIALSREATDDDVELEYMNDVHALYRMLSPYVSEEEYEEYKKEKLRDYGDYYITRYHSGGITKEQRDESAKECNALYRYCIQKMYDIGLMPVEKKGEKA